MEVSEKILDEIAKDYINIINVELKGRRLDKLRTQQAEVVKKYIKEIVFKAR